MLGSPAHGISAVESVARVITGNSKAALGDALKIIRKTIPIHGSLREAMNQNFMDIQTTRTVFGIRCSMTREASMKRKRSSCSSHAARL
jgi:hypothetical protein